MITKQSSEGIMPDSSAHIARLESKLSKLKKPDNKITATDLITSMNQFKEVYMRDYFKTNNNSQNEENSIILETINKTILERKLIPEQPLNTEETQLLIENDWLLNDKSKEQEPECKN